MKKPINIMNTLTPKPPKGANGGDAVKFGKPKFVSMKAKVFISKGK